MRINITFILLLGQNTPLFVPITNDGNIEEMFMLKRQSIKEAFHISQFTKVCRPIQKM
jgi:hypothetical protein